MKKKSDVHNGFGRQVPPHRESVLAYFQQKGAPVPVAMNFFLFMEQNRWRTTTGTPVRNWKKAAFRWLWPHKINHFIH